MITQPGIYPSVSHEIYHADPVRGGSLSSTGARLLLAAPAKYAYRLHNPELPKKVYDLGQAAHSLVLGAGPQPVEIPEDLLASNGAVSTTEAKAFVAESRAAGLVPLKPAEMVTVLAMANRLREHPLASTLLDSEGVAEQTLVWQDRETGVNCRARLDWLPIPNARGLVLNVDYKTSPDASAPAFRRAAANLGYHLQGAWYEDGILATGTAKQTASLWIVQERDAPYLVSVHQFGASEMRLGRDLAAKARRIYAACQAADHWPGYPERVNTITFPPYVFDAADAVLAEEEE